MLYNNLTLTNNQLSLLLISIIYHHIPLLIQILTITLSMHYIVYYNLIIILSILYSFYYIFYQIFSIYFYSFIYPFLLFILNNNDTTHIGLINILTRFKFVYF